MKERLIVGLGEVLWDMLPEGKKIGGAPANFAYHVGQFGLPSLAVSAIGDDPLGQETRAALEAKGLNSLLVTVPYPTGTVGVTLDAAGVPTYLIHEDVAWDNLPLTDELRQVAGSCRAVCFGSLAQRSVTTRDTIRQFLAMTPDDCLKVFDINLRGHFYTPERLEESMHACDILKINDEELVLVSRMLEYTGLDLKEQCRRLIGAFGLRMLVLTCGTNGSYVFTAEGGASYRPTPRVTVADTVGAGDSFTGAFCAAILGGRSVEEAHCLAVDVSAYVCTQAGAMPTLPAGLTAGLKS